MTPMYRPQIALISTGGTIEKTYDELAGVLHNHVSVLDIMLATLVLSVDLSRIALMNKDSIEMTLDDHALIARTAHEQSQTHDGVVVVHGTDRLAVSGECTFALNPQPRTPIVFTGAMRPYALRSTDAMQNLTEALLAAQVMPAGVYVAMHNRVLRFPGVTKDRENGRFVRGDAP